MFLQKRNFLIYVLPLTQSQGTLKLLPWSPGFDTRDYAVEKQKPFGLLCLLKAFFSNFEPQQAYKRKGYFLVDEHEECQGFHLGLTQVECGKKQDNGSILQPLIAMCELNAQEHSWDEHHRSH